MSLTYVDACTDPHLFGPWFSGPTWGAWTVIDKAIFGLPMAAEERTLLPDLTGLTEPPSQPMREAWLCFGRRSGKDLKAASYAVYIATVGAELHGYRRHLQRGERGVVQILAVDRDQAAVCFNYLRAFFEQPMLARLVQRETADSIELHNQLAIEVTTNDRRRVRGRTVICAILDEVAHWRNELSANADVEVFEAIKPATLTIPNPLILGISSPHMRSGLFYRKVSENWGKPGAILGARAPTWVMNPTSPRDHPLIATAYESDAAYAAAEYGAEWRSDLEAFLGLDAVRACIQAGLRVRPAERRNRYIAFADPSGGRADSFTLAIAHREGDTAILDLVHEARPPFSPEGVVSEIAALCKQYRVSRVYGDRYGGEFAVELFRRHAIHYAPAERSKSEIYIDFAPLVNSGAVDLLDHDRLVAQLCALERQPRRGAKDSVDHPRGGHDDVANAVAGTLVIAMTRKAAAMDISAASLPIVEGISGFDPLTGTYRRPREPDRYVLKI